MKKQINVLIKRPFEPGGRVRTIPNELKALQEIVGGYIECVTLASDLAVICDEEGRLKGKPHNCEIAGVDFVGTIIIVGVDGEDFDDIPADPERIRRVIGWQS